MEYKKFIDLHVHSTYSALDGMITPENYVKFAKENNLKTISVSDHGNIDGIIELYEKCKKENIKCILGSEFYLSEGILNEADEEKTETKNNFHLNLYAKNHTGYKNLIKLTTWANKENFYKKPRITFDILKQYSGGLICTSSCVGSIFAYYILNNNAQKAGELCLQFKNLFKNDFYIEFGYHLYPEEKQYITILQQIAKMLDIKTIITNDTHYLYKEEEFAHKILMCKGDKTIADESNFSYTHNYYKNYNEIKSIFSAFPQINVDQCIDNVYEIINKVEDYNIEFGNYVYPELPIPDGETQDSFLFKNILIGAKKKFGNNISKEIIDRLQYEFSVISKMQFSGYFNMVADYISWAKNNGISVGPGRGSGAGSLVAYCLDIVEVNPLQYDLIFERFLNPDRVSFPDIDTDFEKVERENLMKYLTNKYGENGCVQISTKGYLKGKSAIKTVASRLGLGYDIYNKLLSPIKDPKIDTVDKILEYSQDAQKKYNTDTEFQKVCELAKKIEGNVQSTGIHASGVIICHKDISEIVPIVRTKEGFGTAWSDKIVEKLGLIKYDILGLNNLTVIKEAEKRIGNGFNIHNISYNDDNTYKLLQSGYSLGIFQLESEGMKSLLFRLKPTELEHINAVIALFRPGAMQFIDEYIENKNSQDNITYIDDRVKDILRPTYAQMVYQEQVMQISRVLAGYTMAEADSLRKAIGKKKMEEMKKHRDKFISGCVNNNVKEDVATILYEQIEKFAEYSFNKSHSVSYAHIAYQTAYLKANYTLEYMTALLNANSDNLDKLTPYIDECYRLGINVLPPDINKSGNFFEHDKENNAIRFGFNGIKGVGDASIEPIILERTTNGPIKSFSDLLIRIPSLNKTALESLLKVGAFNQIEASPYKYLHTLDYMQKARSKADYTKGKVDLYNSLIDSYIKETSKHKDSIKILNEKKKALTTKKADKEVKDKINLEINNIYKLEKDKFDVMKFEPEIQVLKDWEMELIGFPISNNPKKEIMELVDFIDSTPIEQIKEEKNYGELYYFIGKIKNARRCPNGSYFVIITDEKSEITTFMKGETYNAMSEKLSNSSNYFRICGSLKRSNNEKYDDSLKLESIRYFNTSKDKEVILRIPDTMSIQDIQDVLTDIKSYAILNSEDINYRLSLLVYNQDKREDVRINTKIDYWISDISSIGSLIVRHNITVVN